MIAKNRKMILDIIHKKNLSKCRMIKDEKRKKRNDKHPTELELQVCHENKNNARLWQEPRVYKPLFTRVHHCGINSLRPSRHRYTVSGSNCFHLSQPSAGSNIASLRTSRRKVFPLGIRTSTFRAMSSELGKTAVTTAFGHSERWASEIRRTKSPSAG